MKITMSDLVSNSMEKPDKQNSTDDFASKLDNLQKMHRQSRIKLETYVLGGQNMV